MPLCRLRPRSQRGAERLVSDGENICGGLWVKSVSEKVLHHKRPHLHCAFQFHCRSVSIFLANYANDQNGDRHFCCSPVFLFAIIHLATITRQLENTFAHCSKMRAATSAGIFIFLHLQVIAVTTFICKLVAD